jgi:hypothetical protein
MLTLDTSALPEAQSLRADNATPQLCPCGHAPLQCALVTLALVQSAVRTDPRSAPGCCLGIARRATADFAKARVLASGTFSAVREILPALRGDGMGRTTAAHCIVNAAAVLEHFIDAAERRSRRATTLLRRKFDKDSCPACGGQSALPKAAEQLRWCASMLNGSRR